MNSVKSKKRLDTISTNFENSKTSDPHRLLLSLLDKTNLKRSDKYVTLSNLSIYYLRKKIKTYTKEINLKYQFQHGTKNLNYLMDHIQYQIFKIKHILKKHETLTDNPSIMIYIYKIEN